MEPNPKPLLLSLPLQLPPQTFSQALTAVMFVTVLLPMLQQRPLLLPSPAVSQALTAALYLKIHQPTQPSRKR